MISVSPDFSSFRTDRHSAKISPTWHLCNRQIPIGSEVVDAMGVASRDGTLRWPHVRDLLSSTTITE